MNEGESLRLSKLIFESTEKRFNCQRLSEPSSIAHPFTLSKVLVSICLNITALGSPKRVSTASGYPDFPGLFKISTL